MTNYAARVLSAFSPVDVPPNLSEKDMPLLEHFDAGPLIRGLLGRPWTDFANGDDIFQVEEDALVWTSYLPRDWFLYYLPAMLIAIANSTRDCASNLKGLLALMFEDRAASDAERDALGEYVLGRLTRDQITLLREGVCG